MPADIPQLKDTALPRAPLDPTTSDKAWNQTVEQIEQMGLSLANAFAPAGGSARIFEYFLGQTASAPSGATSYTDGRYWVRRAVPRYSKDSTDQLVCDADPLANGTQYPQYVVATNLGELNTGTHELLNNVIVLVFAFPEQGNFAKKSYVFNLVPHRPIYVHLSLNSGSNGSVSGTTITNATYTYDLLSPETDIPISGATNIAPAGTREQGPLVGPAGIGMARLSADGTTWTLIWCDERRALIACP